jgi:hypothetical protein
MKPIMQAKADLPFNELVLGSALLLPQSWC